MATLEQAMRLLEGTSYTPETLMEAAQACRVHAYAPYSKFQVGAALLFPSGRVIAGCNVENGSYGLSLCAERNAMTTAVSCGEVRPLAVAVAASEGIACPPCGACRQFLSEFNPDMMVLFRDVRNGVRFFTLRELLPERFVL